MDNMETVQKDLKNKLLGRIDEVHDDVKDLRKIVDSNLESISNELLAKSTKECLWSINILKNIVFFLFLGGEICQCVNYDAGFFSVAIVT